METAATKPRRSGRPAGNASETLDQHILAIASRLFIENGYAGTSIEQIAAAAGAGKQTIYRRYESKEDLFKAAITDLGEMLLRSAAIAEASSADPLTSLRETCRAWLDIATMPEAIAIHRVLIADAYRFPSLADYVRDRAAEPFHVVVLRLIRSAREAGQIRSDLDDELTSRVLSGLLTGWRLKQALLGRVALEDEVERATFFQVAWGIFLNGAVASLDRPEPRGTQAARRHGRRPQRLAKV
jgi:AcrR family transcriptional regulator